MIIQFANWAQNLLDKFRALDFLGSLALRLYLAPVFWMAGMNKVATFDGIVDWFGNSDYGLGLPFPTVMASLATGTEVLGAILLVLGLAVRWISVPLMVTMLVAIFTVHLKNGWQAIADKMSPFASADVDGALTRLSAAKDILKEHGNYQWLTEHGNFVVSNNGIEWAVTYFIMLLALFFTGSGKYLSLDYYISKWFRT
jgi:uncharacterized membrane protein YphA (DoxX/SURF4 family)